MTNPTIPTSRKIAFLLVFLSCVAGARKSNAGVLEYLDWMADRLTNQCKPPATLAQWTAGREELRRKAMGIIGLDPLPEKTPLHARLVGSAVDLDNCTFQRVVFESRPNVFVAAHLYVPKDVSFPVPAVIHVPGHSRRDAYRAHPRTFAENGFVSIALPMIGEEGKRGAGWGKCGEYGPYKGHFNWYSTGYSAIGPSVWDGMRAVDYLLTLKDGNGNTLVDTTKIGMAGLSGGSARVLWTAIADPRIACASASCGFTAIKDYDQPGGVSGTCDVHLFYNCFGLTYGELYSLIAPRAFLVQHGTKDRLYPNPKPVADYVREIYKLYGQSENFDFVTYDQGHSYGGGVWDHENSWMDKWLRTGDSPLTMYDQFTATLTCFPDGEPADMAHTERLFTPPTPEWTIDTKEEFTRFKDALMGHLRNSVIRTAFEDINAKLETVRRDEHAEYYVEVKELTLGDGTLTHRGYFFCKPGEPRTTVIRLADDKIDETALSALYRKNYLDTGINLFCLEITGIGGNAWSTDKSYLFDRFAQLVGHTKCSLRINDVLAAVKTISAEEGVDSEEIYLWGKGNLAVPVIYSAVVDNKIAGVVLEDAPDRHIGITSAEATGCETALFHILKYADIPQASGLIFPRKMILTGTTLPGFQWTKALYGQLGAGENFLEDGGSVKDLLSKIVIEGDAKPFVRQSRAGVGEDVYRTGLRTVSKPEDPQDAPETSSARPSRRDG
jgi:hypothetical protein